MNITVNGETIAQLAIDAEVQYHPAADLETARKAAAEALVIRALLRQAAGRMGDRGRARAGNHPARGG